ncbi:MAG: trimethylamine methyltransferase family protein [Anaerolineales bacterium]|nr:trimethylamine methyltransferase family protein [Anaerolineales bacterium]
MRTQIQVLSEQEKHRVHESTLNVLANTGVRVETSLGRKYLAEAGAQVDDATRIVRFPKDFVEQCLQLAPKEFTLGARRPGWDLEMNTGECVLMIDGSAPTVLELGQVESRPGKFDDWLKATRLTDAIDEFGVYWAMVDASDSGEGMDETVKYWRHLFGNFSKHIQDGIDDKVAAPWLLEVLQVVFGDKETIRRTHPYSFLICPQSPLTIDKVYTEAYLALVGYDIPVAIMPMPLMGGTAPANMISTTIQGNCEVISMLCLIQAAAPETPIIYAAALATMDPRTALYGGGRIEDAILGMACVEMGKYYGLPVEGSGGGTDHSIPSIQAGYERGISAVLPILSWPDLMIGAGLLGGSMVLSLEQLIIDVEVFRMSKHVARGIDTSEDAWLDDVIAKVGPGGHYLEEDSTIAFMRGGEYYHPQIGHHGIFDSWLERGQPDLLDEAHERVQTLLAEHTPLPLSPEADRELKIIAQKADDA